MVFCNKTNEKQVCYACAVTILILIDGFLQYKMTPMLLHIAGSHNPYFNRWFSAMIIMVIKQITLDKSQSLF